MENRRRAAIYCRTSRDDHDDPRLSIGTQIENGKALALKQGFDVADEHIFIDQGLSGKLPPTRWQNSKLTKKNHRPGLEGAMVALESDVVQALVIRHRDRLCRSLRLSIDLFGFFESLRAELYATDDTIAVTDNATARLQLHLLMSIAQYHMDVTQEAVRKAKERQKAEGLKMGPVFTLGYLEGPIPGRREQALKQRWVVPKGPLVGPRQPGHVDQQDRLPAMVPLHGTTHGSDGPVEVYDQILGTILSTLLGRPEDHGRTRSHAPRRKDLDLAGRHHTLQRQSRTRPRPGFGRRKNLAWSAGKDSDGRVQDGFPDHVKEF